MSNVTNPPGPVNPTNPQQSTEPTKPGTDKFKDLMKIDSSAEKQGKRKKRSTESQEEGKAKLQAGPAEPHKHVDSTKRAQKYPKIQKVDESTKKQTKHGKRSEETTSELAREEAAALAQKKPVQPLEIPTTDHEARDAEDSAKISAANIQANKDLEQILEEEKQVLHQEETTQSFKKIASQKEESKKAPIEPSSTAPSTTTLGPSFLPPPTTTAPAYSLLNAEALALFEKMVSVISILKESGVTETTLHLGTPEFANSQFYGAQIVIREYSTAPLLYNIEFFGNPLAADLFRKNLPLLRSAFSDPKYRFRINRLEASIAQHPRVECKNDSSQQE